MKKKMLILYIEILDMVILTTFTIIELATASVAILGAFGMCLVRVIGQAEQSRCSKINCCCLTCDRTPPETFTDISAGITETELVEQSSDFDGALSDNISRK